MPTGRDLDARGERNPSWAPIRPSLKEGNHPAAPVSRWARRLTPRAQATYRLRAKTAETEVPNEPHGRTAVPYASRALVPGPYPRPPALLGGLWLRHPAAL